MKAGRIGDAVRDLPVTLEAALAPGTAVARAALDELRKASPDQIAVEFGIDLAFEAGAVITKTGTAQDTSGGTSSDLVAAVAQILTPDGTVAGAGTGLDKHRYSRFGENDHDDPAQC